MAREVDLDELLLSPRAVFGWLAKVRESAVALEGVNPQLIPDERARINDDGTLTIFVEIPGIITISMEVPRGDWAYRQ
ncbi:MAG: hypothetical protein HYV13_02595 [Candidatus Doudnabacteria bacterium]|nr:hypothetical protein [Candidatus Doudnabacteria bacterium]